MEDYYDLEVVLVEDLFSSFKCLKFRKGGKSIKISDPLYGSYKLEEVLCELILAPSIQRLKKVYQAGASRLVSPKWNVTRYEHSVGVMLLIRKFGGTIEEQIAGLLHDLSHTAFSHVIDYVAENKDENYHDLIFKEVLNNSEIPNILKKHHFNYEDILFDLSKWTLLERSLPEMCADRIDYTLRDLYRYGYITMQDVQTIIDDLAVTNGRFYFRSLNIAEKFVEIYYKEVVDFFMHPLNVYANEIMTELLKRSLSAKIITYDDLLKNDDELIEYLIQSDQIDVKNLLGELNKKVILKENKDDYDIHFTNKLRLIDPLVKRSEGLIYSSTVSENIRLMTAKAKKQLLQGVYIKIVSR